ncbi:MAG: 3-hydroxybutyryl-CoA dehydrogenase [Chloroflexi bacterium]|nr:3-hydroxybutyryl-CoA dehydrogenase [Chloroflexota bacterium]
MNVLIQGNAAECETFSRLYQQAGHTTDASARVDIALDLHLADKAAKQAWLKGATADVILTAAVPCSATEAASWSPHPDRVVGISPIFGNMIELAPALQTPPDALERAEAFLRSLNLEVVRVADGPGLVRLRVLCCLINEAASALAEGVASSANIDTAMKLGVNYPRGLLEWGDALGLEVVLAVLRALQADYGEDRYRPSPLLIRKALAGQKFS